MLVGGGEPTLVIIRPWMGTPPSGMGARSHIQSARSVALVQVAHHHTASIAPHMSNLVVATGATTLSFWPSAAAHRQSGCVAAVQ